MLRAPLTACDQWTPTSERVDVQPVIDWLIEGAKPATEPKQGLSLLCRRMLECGLRLDRVAVFVRPLHPNVVARIEALCKTLNAQLVVSEQVATHTRHEWRRLGSHPLRGVGKPVELFTLP